MSNAQLFKVFVWGCVFFLAVTAIAVLDAGWAGVAPLGGLLMWLLVWGMIWVAVGQENSS